MTDERESPFSLPFSKAYESARAVVYVADARDVLPALVTESFDLIVTDPPYGQEFISNQRVERFDAIALDGASDREAVREVLEECVRLVGQNRHLYVFGPEDVLKGLKITKPVSLVWDKTMMSGGDLTAPWGRSHEPIWFAVSKHRHAGQAGQDSIPSRIRKGSVLRFGRATGRTVRHPTEKPVDLLAELIEIVQPRRRHRARPVRGHRLDRRSGCASWSSRGARGGRRAVCECRRRAPAGGRETGRSDGGGVTSYGNSSRLQVPFVVIVPFRGNGNQHRAKAFDALLAHLVEHDAVVKVSNPAGAWSPGRARNHGVRHLDYMETSVVVFNDADTICPWNQTLEAVEMAATKPGLVYAYDLYLRRGEDGRLEQELYSPPSMGCAAISVDAFHQVGGFDERFEGWGYEDCDFALRCNRLWDNRRVSGPVEHLWHGDRRHDDSPLDSEPVLTERNWDRWNAQTA